MILRLHRASSHPNQGMKKFDWVNEIVEILTLEGVPVPTSDDVSDVMMHIIQGVLV